MIRVRLHPRVRAGRDDFAVPEATAIQLRIAMPVLDEANQLFSRLVDRGEQALARLRKRLTANAAR